MSLRDQLLKAGLVSAADAQHAEADRARAAREHEAADPSIRGITGRYLRAARPDEGFQQAMRRASDWLAALYRAGHRERLTREFGEVETPVQRTAAPVDRATIARMEEEIGFSLPPSYRAFLQEVGGVAFLNPWWDATIAPADLVRATREFQNWGLGDFAALARQHHEHWAPGPFQLVPVCEYHNGDYYFMARNLRDGRDESPIFLVCHDEPACFDEGAPGFAQWFSERIDLVIEEAVRRVARAEEAANGSGDAQTGVKEAG